MFSGVCSAHQGTPLQLGLAEDGLAGSDKEPRHPWGTWNRCGLTSQGSRSSAACATFICFEFQAAVVCALAVLFYTLLEQRIPGTREKC